MSYDPKSLKAEEFINHEEILETLAYADANKHNRELIEEILEKARPKKRFRQNYIESMSAQEYAMMYIKIPISDRIFADFS